MNKEEKEKKKKKKKKDDLRSYDDRLADTNKKAPDDTVFPPGWDGPLKTKVFQRKKLENDAKRITGNDTAQNGTTEKKDTTAKKVTPDDGKPPSQPLEPGLQDDFTQQCIGCNTDPNKYYRNAAKETEELHNMTQGQKFTKVINYLEGKPIAKTKQKMNDAYLARTKQKNAAIKKSKAAYRPRGGKYSRIKRKRITRKGMRKTRAKSKKNYKKNSKKHYKRR